MQHAQGAQHSGAGTAAAYTEAILHHAKHPFYNDGSAVGYLPA